jgi:ABC-type multidrug transport system ATPase subunit
VGHPVEPIVIERLVKSYNGTLAARDLSFSVDPGRTGRNHLRVLAATAGASDARVDELLDLVNLSDVGRRPAGQYWHPLAAALPVRVRRQRPGRTGLVQPPT